MPSKHAGLIYYDNIIMCVLVYKTYKDPLEMSNKTCATKEWSGYIKASKKKLHGDIDHLTCNIKRISSHKGYSLML